MFCFGDPKTKKEEALGLACNELGYAKAENIFAFGASQLQF